MTGYKELMTGYKLYEDVLIKVANDEHYTRLCQLFRYINRSSTEQGYSILFKYHHAHVLGPSEVRSRNLIDQAMRLG